MARILLADDEPDLVWALRHSLSGEGYEVLTACNGVEALTIARRHHPDLVILDITMPGLDGLQVCQRLRQDSALSTVPILFLTVRSAIEDKITGLDEGGDDYLVKPFDLRELKARIKVLLRRARRAPRGGPLPGAKDAPLVVGSITLDPNTYLVHVGTKTVRPTPVEFDLLCHLMARPGKIFSGQQLLQEVWGYPPEMADTGLVRWHIMNLRAKIEPDPAHPVFIRTVPRQGYIFTA